MHYWTQQTLIQSKPTYKHASRHFNGIIKKKPMGILTLMWNCVIYAHQNGKIRKKIKIMWKRKLSTYNP